MRLCTDADPLAAVRLPNVGDASPDHFTGDSPASPACRRDDPADRGCVFIGNSDRQDPGVSHQRMVFPGEEVLALRVEPVDVQVRAVLLHDEDLLAQTEHLDGLIAPDVGPGLDRVVDVHGVALKYASIASMDRMIRRTLDSKKAGSIRSNSSEGLW